MAMKIETREQAAWEDQFSGKSPFLSIAALRKAHENLDALSELIGGKSGMPPELYALLDELIDSESSAAGFVARRLTALVEG